VLDLDLPESDMNRNIGEHFSFGASSWRPKSMKVIKNKKPFLYRNSLQKVIIAT